MKQLKFIVLLVATFTSLGAYATGCTDDNKCNYTYKNATAYRMDKVQPSGPGSFPISLAPGFQENYPTQSSSIEDVNSDDACKSYQFVTTLVYALPRAPSASPNVVPTCAFTIAMACGGADVTAEGKKYWVGLVSNPTSPLLYCQNLKPSAKPILQLEPTDHIATVNGKEFYQNIKYTLIIK